MCKKKTCHRSGFPSKISSKSSHFSKIYDTSKRVHFLFDLTVRDENGIISKEMPDFSFVTFSTSRYRIIVKVYIESCESHFFFDFLSYFQDIVGNRVIRFVGTLVICDVGCATLDILWRVGKI
eukprot:UN27423